MASADEGGIRRPNILWITTHDINPDLGAYRGVWPGAEYALTPNLDRLASEGARYDNAYAAAPICSPSRSAIITGCFPTAIGTMHMRTKAVPPPEVRLLPEYFRQAGYYTTNNFFTDFQVMTPPTTFDDCSPTAHWRNRPEPSTPFFAAFHGMLTHESQLYLSEEDFRAKTPHAEELGRHDPALAPIPPYYPDGPPFRDTWARYADLITEMDWWVGNLLAELEQDGLADSTIVVFWSDHGLGMPRAKRWATEAGLHEPLLIRWPKVIEPGTIRRELVHLMDLAPTMLAACGLPVPEHMHGVPLIAADGGLVDAPNEHVFGSRDRQGEEEDTTRTVRDARYRYIEHFHPDRAAMQYSNYADRFGTWQEFRRLAFEEAEQLARGEVRSLLTPNQRAVIAPRKPRCELYDLLKDPYELVNLADDPDYREVVDRLAGALHAWQSEHGDLGLVSESDLIESWRPGGETPVTKTPSARTLQDGRIELECTTDGASIGWTTEAEPADVVNHPALAVTGWVGDGRRWNLYSGPFVPPVGQFFVRAWRLGFEGSEELVVGGG